MPFWLTAQLQGEVETLRKATVELKRKVDDHVALEAQEQVDAEEEVGHSVALSHRRPSISGFQDLVHQNSGLGCPAETGQWVCSIGGSGLIKLVACGVMRCAIRNGRRLRWRKGSCWTASTRMR